MASLRYGKNWISSFHVWKLPTLRLPVKYIVHEPRPIKIAFLSIPMGHSEFSIKLKLIVYILIIYLLLFM